MVPSRNLSSLTSNVCHCFLVCIAATSTSCITGDKTVTSLVGSFYDLKTYLRQQKDLKLELYQDRSHNTWVNLNFSRVCYSI